MQAVYFGLCWVFVPGQVFVTVSLVAARGGYSSAEALGLLIAVASLVAEHGL